MNDIIKKLTAIDRRYLFIIIALVVVIPLIFKPQFPIVPKEPVIDAYRAVDSLQAGDNVMISIDYDAASMPELQPFLEALLRHCFRKELNPVMLVQWQLGAPLGTRAMEKIAAEFDVEYGVDYINLGYRPGYTAQIVGIGKEIRDYFITDYKGDPIDSFPVMNDIHNYDDIDILVGLEAGATGNIWVQYAGARYNQRIILALTAVSAPDAYFFYQSGQIEGLVGGMKGSADYETLIDHPDVAVAGMAAQSFVHILIIIFIILGNIAYFVEKRNKGNKLGGR